MYRTLCFPAHDSLTLPGGVLDTGGSRANLTLAALLQPRRVDDAGEQACDRSQDDGKERSLPLLLRSYTP